MSKDIRGFFFGGKVRVHRFCFKKVRLMTNCRLFLTFTVQPAVPKEVPKVEKKTEPAKYEECATIM